MWKGTSCHKLEPKDSYTCENSLDLVEIKWCHLKSCHPNTLSRLRVPQKRLFQAYVVFWTKKPFVWIITVYVHGVMSCDVEVWCHGLEYAANSCSSFFPINFDRWLNPIYSGVTVLANYLFSKSCFTCTLQ